MSSANKDDKLVSIRAKFGLWGIGAYWSIVEFAAEQLEEKSDKAQATLIVSELVGFLGCKRNKLVSFLEHSANISLFYSSLSGNILQVDIPKLLEFADNYIKYDGKSLKSLQRQKEMSSKHRIEVEEKRIEEDCKHTLVSESCESVLAKWNEFAKENGLSEVRALSPKRRAGILSRQKEPEFNLDEIFTKIRESDFLRGQNDNGWKADFDFVFCSANNYLKIVEGKYANNQGRTRKAIDPNSVAARASFRHGPEQLRRLEELTESLKQSDRERRERA